MHSFWLLQGWHSALFSANTWWKSCAHTVHDMWHNRTIGARRIHILLSKKCLLRINTPFFHRYTPYQSTNNTQRIMTEHICYSCIIPTIPRAYNYNYYFKLLFI